jgi:hypothetical protein
LTLKIKVKLNGIRYAFDINVLNSENETELIRLDPIIIYIRTSRGSNAERALVAFY